MNNLLSKIKANVVMYALIAVAAIVAVYMFLRRGGSLEEFAKLRDEIEDLRLQRERNLGKIEELDEDNERIDRDLEEVVEERRELEGHLDNSRGPRDQLRDFVDRYGGGDE